MLDTSRLTLEKYKEALEFSLEEAQRHTQLVPHLSMRRPCVPAMKLIIVLVILLVTSSTTHARRALTSLHGRLALKGPESCGGCDSTRQFLCSSNERTTSQVPLSAEEPASTEQEAYALVVRLRGGGEHVFGFDTAGEDQRHGGRRPRKGIDFNEGSAPMIGSQGCNRDWKQLTEGHQERTVMSTEGCRQNRHFRLSRTVEVTEPTGCFPAPHPPHLLCPGSPSATFLMPLAPHPQGG
jgi:hypothetical protein